MIVFRWTDAATIRLMQLLDVENLTASQAAVVMSKEFDFCFSRNSIIGRSHRMRVATPAKSPRRTQAAILKDARARAAELAPIPQEYRVEIENGRSIISVKNSECKFYINSGDDPFLCCGKPVEHGRPYCSHHVSIAYYRAPKPDPKTTPREYRVVRQFADIDQ